MKASDNIIDKINRLPLGYVFTYDDFDLQVNNINAITKALSRLVTTGKISKLSPGRFYKPRITEFGELKPEPYQVVKDLLEQNNRITGYLTGYSVYNQLGLTTQVSSVIQIGVNELKKNLSRGTFKVRFVRQYNRITKENIPLLRILDCIRNIRDIPGSTPETSINLIKGIVKSLNADDIALMVRLALKYNPATRALTGAILENVSGPESVEALQKSLNPSSSYKFGFSNGILPNKLKWAIV